MIGPIANSNILLGALQELNAIGAGDTAQPELLQAALDMENLILDQWNASEDKVYAESFLSFTVVPNLNPTPIGPGATWNTGAGVNRPVDIKGIQIRIGSAPQAFIYCRKRDAQWWQTQPSPQTTSAFPTDFFYNPAWTTAAPYGAIYFWPVPTTAYTVQLWTRIVLGQLTVNQQISLPPGYAYAIRMTLAENLASSLRKPWTPIQSQKAAEARTVITANNYRVPRIKTRDSGMPTSDAGNMPDFFWPSGLLTGPR